MRQSARTPLRTWTSWSRKVHGPLRATLAAQLGAGHGGLLADRIRDALTVHAPSGIRRRKAEPRPAITIGVVEFYKGARTARLVTGLRSLGLGVVVVGADDDVGRIESAAIDALLVPIDLPLAEVREIAWRNAQRDEPALVVVWPVGDVRPSWGKALGDPIVLTEASFTLLARVLADHASERVRSSRHGTRG